MSAFKKDVAPSVSSDFASAESVTPLPSFDAQAQQLLHLTQSNSGAIAAAALLLLIVLAMFMYFGFSVR